MRTRAIVERIRNLTRGLRSRPNRQSCSLGDLRLRRLALGRKSGQLRRLRGKEAWLLLRHWRRRRRRLWRSCGREPRELRLELSSREPRGLGMQLGTSKSCILRRISSRLRSEARRLRLLRLGLLGTGGELRVWLL